MSQKSSVTQTPQSVPKVLTSDKEFPFTDEIEQFLGSKGVNVRGYAIHINGKDAPLTRSHRGVIQYSETKTGEFDSWEKIEMAAVDSGIAAVGWIAHHDYQGALPRNSGVSGLRARVGNIQIGANRLFAEVFPEERFNSWTIGEIHVLDPRVLPNARRDEFEPSTHLSNIFTHLIPHTGSVARKCRTTSQVRNRIKEFDAREQKATELLEIIEQGAVSRSMSAAMKKELGTTIDEARKAAGFDLIQDSAKQDLAIRLRALEKRTDATTTVAVGASDDLDFIPSRKRSAYKEAIDLIYECSANRIAAKSLVDRMIVKLRHLYASE